MLPNSVTYSEDVAREYVTRLAAGEVVESICQDSHMPDRNTILRWRNKYADFDAAVKRAQEISAHAMAEQTIYIADTDKDPQRARNRIAARQWLAAKRSPKIYGDKIDVTVSERPSLKPAIDAAFERIDGPVCDQLTQQSQQVIDLTAKFFGDPDDYQSSAPVIPSIFDDDG